MQIQNIGDKLVKRKPLKKLNQKTKKIRKRLNVNIYVLPNLITTMNMFFGFFAIIHAIGGQYMWSAYAIVAAAIFDLLDGRVARITHSESEFGAEYDSLCDLVSFGLAPGLLLFQWALQPFGRLGWLACFFYVACGALRLARFNVMKTVMDKSHFQGLPIPMAAGIVASSVLAFNDLGWEAEKSILLLGITFLLGFVMVTSFRYRSFKDLDLKDRLPFKYLVVGVFVLAVIAIRPEVMLFVLFLSYAVLGAIFGILRIGPNKKSMLSNDDISDSELEEEDDDEVFENEPVH